MKIGKLASAHCVLFHPTNDHCRSIPQTPAGLPSGKVLQEVDVVHAGFSTSHVPEGREPPKEARAEQISAVSGHLIAYY